MNLGLIVNLVHNVNVVLGQFLPFYSILVLYYRRMGIQRQFGTQRQFEPRRRFEPQRCFGTYRHFGKHQLQGGIVVVLYESKCTMIYQKYNYFEEDSLIYLNLLRNFLILSIE